MKIHLCGRCGVGFAGSCTCHSSGPDSVARQSAKPVFGAAVFTVVILLMGLQAVPENSETALNASAIGINSLQASVETEGLNHSRDGGIAMHELE